MKSGASFSRERISKVDKLFKAGPEPAIQKDLTPEEEVLDKDEILLNEIDSKLEINKADTIEAQHAQNLDLIKKLQTEFMQLLNRRKETLMQLRRKNKIVLEGNNLETVPELTPSWSSMATKLNFNPNFLKAIREAGHKKPTPVQMQTIPVIMQSRDAIVLAETGSGKSLSFFVPLLEKIKKGSGLQCFVIAPTRELTI